MERTLLKNISSFSQGQQIPMNMQESTEYAGSDKFIRIINYTQNSKEFRFIPKQSPKYLVDETDIIMVRYGAIGFVGRGLAGILANNMFKINYDKDRVDGNYLYHILKSEKIQSYIVSNSQKTSMAAINFKTVGGILIPLPPLATQKRIAKILDDAAALRDTTAKLLKEYDLLAQSIFLEMFGDPVVNPKGWDAKTIKNLGKTTTGNTPSRSIPQNFGDFIEWIKTDNINTPNTILTKASEYLSELGLKKARSVNKGAILVTCIAGSRKVIGNVALADRSVSFNQQINAFEPYNECSMFWFYHFIIAKKYVQNNSTTGMKGIITKGKFEKMLFINPPIKLQNQFAEKIALIEQQKALAKQELKESEDLFNCLLQKAFKGELV